MTIYNVVAMNFNKVHFMVDDLLNFKIHRFIIKNGDDILKINHYEVFENKFTILLNSTINIKEECFVIYEDLKVKANYSTLFSSKEFNYKYYCDSDLGYKYTKDNTIFKVWSPAAKNISLLIYKESEPSLNEKPEIIKTEELSNGLWYCDVQSDLDGYYYTYEVTVYNKCYEAVDPYTTAIGVNGLRGAIINLNKTNPDNWKDDTSPRLKSFTDAIIYETNIRDISIHHNSGVKNKGKFMGLTEETTFSDKNICTVLSHIKELGITHIQFMPIFDFSHKSIDEKNPTKYNWGYDPQNYNVPEGSYSTNPFSPYCRIYELKLMIMKLHKNGFCVNMDVVFNHLWHHVDNNFQKIFPGYYFRYYEDGSMSNGSGCSNDTASENLMMRKFIVDSVKFWSKEYHIDGFRFDLMGLHDIETMNSIRKELDNIDSNIMLYGEGWNLNTALDDDNKACIKNSLKLPKIGHFNDVIRDTIKGNIFIPNDKGYATGKSDLESLLKNCIAASIKNEKSNMGIFYNPCETINYVSCHDNYTLWDKICVSCENESLENKKYMHKLCNGIILTSQGIAFLHSGVEFCRTKNMIENSFTSLDNINWIDWDRKALFIDVFQYYKDLINLRKSHSAFRMSKKEDISSHLLFLSNMPKNVVAFILKDHANGDSWKNILIIYNPNKNVEMVNIPYTSWNLVGTRDKISQLPLEIIEGDKVQLAPISMTILYCND